jgi:hypothetical protein
VEASETLVVGMQIFGKTGQKRHELHELAPIFCHRGAETQRFLQKETDPPSLGFGAARGADGEISDLRFEISKGNEAMYVTDFKGGVGKFSGICEFGIWSFGLHTF